MLGDKMELANSGVKENRNLSNFTLPNLRCTNLQLFSEISRGCQPIPNAKCVHAIFRFPYSLDSAALSQGRRPPGNQSTKSVK